MSNTAEVASNCELCAEPAADRLLYHDDAVYAIIHPDRAVAGHAMLVARRHVENVADLSSGETVHFADVHRRLEHALLRVTGTDRMILLKLGLKTPHLHLHLYPVSREFDRTAVWRAFDATSRWDGSDVDERALIVAVREELDAR